MTLLQLKNAPVHRLRPMGRNDIGRTYCGVNPYRKGVTTEGCNSGIRKATCKACLRKEREES